MLIRRCEYFYIKKIQAGTLVSTAVGTGVPACTNDIRDACRYNKRVNYYNNEMRTA